MAEPRLRRPVTDRRGYIGASDAAAILGIDYTEDAQGNRVYRKTPTDAWLEITGQREPEPSGVPARLGNYLEDWIAREVAAQMGYQVRRRHYVVQHPAHPFIGAHLDRIVAGLRDRLVECKSVEMFRAQEFGPPGSDEVPARVFAQVQMQLGLARRKVADVGVLRGKLKVEVYHVEFRPDLFDDMVARLVEWFRRHVLGGEPPEPIDCDDLVRQFPSTTPKECVRADDEILRLIARINALDSEARRIERESEVAHLELQRRMQTAEAVVDGLGELVAWRERRYFDEAAFVAAHPDIAARYTSGSLDKEALQRHEKTLYEAFKTGRKRPKTCTLTKRAKSFTALPAPATNGNHEEPEQ